MRKKTSRIIVLGKYISVTKDDYISLTDMLKAKDGDYFISDCLRNITSARFIRNFNFLSLISTPTYPPLKVGYIRQENQNYLPVCVQLRTGRRLSSAGLIETQSSI